MKKTIYYLTFLVHAYPLISFGLDDVTRIGGAALSGGLTGGSSGAFAAGVGSATGTGDPGFDMSGFDVNAGGASGIAAIDPSGFAPMSDAQIEQMRAIANSMPVEAPSYASTASYQTQGLAPTQTSYDPMLGSNQSLGYDPALQPTPYIQDGILPADQVGYPAQIPVSGSDFSASIPVDYSAQPPPLPYLPPAYGTQPPGYPVDPGAIAATAYVPPTQPAVPPAYAPTAPPPTISQTGSGSGLDPTQTALLSTGGSVAGVATGGYIYKKATSAPPNDQMVLSAEQARLANITPLVDESDVEWGGIVKTKDKNGQIRVYIKRPNVALKALWSSETKARYKAKLAQSKRELENMQKRQLGISSSQSSSTIDKRNLVEEYQVEYGELYDSYDDHGKPTLKIKKPGMFTVLSKEDKTAYESRKKQSEFLLRSKKVMPAGLTPNPMFRTTQPQRTPPAIPVRYGSSLDIRYPASTTAMSSRQLPTPPVARRTQSTRTLPRRVVR